MPVFGLSHVDVPVRSLARSEALWTQVLEFWVKRRGDGFVDIDTGTLLVRLLQTDKVEHPVTLRLQVGDVEALVQALRQAGLRTVYAPMRTPDKELFAQVMTDEGHLLTVWRELSEDEYEDVPELPKEISWEPSAEALLKSLLKSVPALFRALVRWRVVKNAEILAESTRLVTKQEVIRSFILSSAKVTRYRVRKPLEDHGVDLGQYAVEFAADERM